MITTIGIDLAKTTLHAVVMDAGGKVVQRRRLDRTKLLEWLANQGPCLVGMEACAGAHHLARALAAQGHDVRLMPGQYVKPSSRRTRTTSPTRRRSARRCSGRRCALCRSRRRRSSTCRRCTGRATGWSGCAPR